jgi:hypothetical protein
LRQKINKYTSESCDVMTTFLLSDVELEGPDNDNRSEISCTSNPRALFCQALCSASVVKLVKGCDSEMNEKPEDSVRNYY